MKTKQKQTKGTKTASELEYLKWFRIHADFGPGEGDVIAGLNKRFQAETGKGLPKGWDDE